MDLELNSLDWNGNELEHEHKLEDMKHTNGSMVTECVERQLRCGLLPISAQKIMFL